MAGRSTQAASVPGLGGGSRTKTSPTHPPVRGGAPYCPAGLQPVPVNRFSSPLTRMLLAGNGSTTLLLQALTGGSISASVRSVRARPIGHLPDRSPALLQLAPGATAFVRRSLLLDQHGRPVSRNEVIIPADNPIGRCLAEDLTRPIGLNLIANFTYHVRELLVTGLAPWDAAPFGARREASSKAYLIHASGRPLMLIWEIYNPEVVSPTTTQRGEPVPIGSASRWSAGE